MDPEQLTLSYEQAAKRLGISVRTIKRMVAAKRIATVKLASRPRIPLQELERFGRSPGTK